MSKVFAVFDEPVSCDYCPFFNGEFWKCRYANRYLDEEKEDPDFKQDWCPLKPVPEKINIPDWDDNIKAENKNAQEVGMYMYDRGHYRGYNICIDEILGE